MRAIKTAALALALALLACGARAIVGRLPMPPAGLASEKYDGFSGVLRAWIGRSAEAQYGAQAWINRQAAAFERAHPGTYVHLTCVEDDKLASAARSAQPPDVMLFRAGDAPPDGLAALDDSDIMLMPAFRACGVAGEARVAAPVAAGGYALAIRGEAPEQLSELPDASMGLPDGWELILTALCERYVGDGASDPGIAAPDVGLTSIATPAPTPSPAEGTALRADSLVRGEFDALLSDFLDGKLRAMPVDQRQIERIRAGQAQGRWADVRFLNAAGYSDQLLLAAVVSPRGDGASERAGMCAQFIRHLLSDDCQAGLKAHGLFPVAVTSPLYGGIAGMAQIEEALRRSDCLTQGAFEAPPSVNFPAILSGETTPREAMRALRNAR